MFTRLSRSGGRTYLQLVESYRNEAGQPRQRVIANLGRLDQLSAEQLEPLIQHHHILINQQPVTGMARIGADQLDLFQALNLPPPAENIAL